MKATARLLGLSLLGILAACLLAEGALRVLGLYEHVELSYDRATGLIRYEPSTSYRSKGDCYDHMVPINALGLYGPDLAPEKEPGIFRIIVAGSSFVEGMQVTLPERFDTLLEEKLNARAGRERFEVAALGFPANGTYLNMLYYEEYMRELSPDLVIDLMTDYDLAKDAPTTTVPPRFSEDGSVVLTLPEARRNEFVIAGKSLARESRLFEALYQRYLALRAAANELLHPETVTTKSDGREDFATTWETEGRLFRSFKALVEDGTDARFAVASWTTAGHEDRDFVGRELRPRLAELSIPYIDLAPALDRMREETGKDYMLSCDGHWGADGHAFVADALKEEMLRLRLIR